MKIIRWSFLVTTAVIVALIIAFNILFLDKILKNIIISTTQPIVGAKVEIDYLKTNLKNCSIVINGFRCADKNDYFKNLIDIESTKFDIKFWPILRKKFIIDEMSVEGLRWQTARKTSGELPKKKLKKQQESKFDKLFKSAKNKTIEEFNNLPSVETFNKIQEQINDFDVNKLIEDSGLSSIKEVEKYSTNLQDKYKSYQDKINNMNIEEKINNAKTIIDEVSKTNISNFADAAKVAKKIKELKTIKSEFDEILKELDNAKKDINSTVDITKQIKNSVTRDVDMISKKISLPALDTKNISQMLFGSIWVNRVEKTMYYMSIVKKYMPEKSEDDKKEVKQRAKGRDIIFKQKFYPTLLISKINLSGTTAKTKEETGIDFSGLIKNISSSPSMIGEPITLELAGNNATQKIEVDGLFDYRTKDSKQNVKVALTGLEGNILSIEPNDYLPLIDTAKINVLGTFDLNSDGFLCSADISFKDMKEKVLDSVEGNLKYLVQITNSIKSFNVNLVAQTQDSDNLDLKIKSDIDNKLYDAISKLFSSKVNEAKNKIRQKVNEMAQAKAKEIEKSLQDKKDEVLKQIGDNINIITDIEKNIENAIKNK